ncbi:MMPL family transporter [Aeromicrobium ginsengisoli]|uniref:MMPL family transporter n=1 Tax=Aeromicrobium ginsengisoli TaxID=363867 RepID=A0A5M4F915_9ACTN|nr:MMPL family transporter [Aeromicrobium ginsengisoli]KAA1394208.1 MMPL family transporter [Aeromicrobium ginsengisoli]
MVGARATFGILVLIFQDGRFENLLNYSSQNALESSQPVFLFVVVFGLSTDYAVFLLTRIKEARDNGAIEREAIAIGMRRNGPIVTAAAVLFAIALGSFATSEIIFIKELGVATALAVLIDAFLVRTIVVPALMTMFGKANWWARLPCVASTSGSGSVSTTRWLSLTNGRWRRSAPDQPGPRAAGHLPPPGPRVRPASPKTGRRRPAPSLGDRGDAHKASAIRDPGLCHGCARRIRFRV